MSLPRSRKLLKPFLFSVLVVMLFYELPTSFVRRFHQDSDAALDFATLAPPPAATTERPKARPPRTQAPLAKHQYRSDGLVETNLDGPHPIYELISRAEQDWEAKLERASKTLDEAVAEYKRRYSRRPPKGFDLWYVLCASLEVEFLSITGGVMLRSTMSSCRTSTIKFITTSNPFGALSRRTSLLSSRKMN